MVKIAALNLACFALGIALGLAFASKGASRVPGAAQDVPAQERAPADGLAEGPASEPESAGLPREAADDLARIVAAIPAPRIEQGSGTISGRVATESGEPVPGVLIRASQHRDSTGRRSRRGGGAPRQPSLEEQVRSTVEGHRWAAATRREVRTDAAGAFAFTGLPDAKYAINAYADGYEIESRRNTYQIEPGATIEFVAKAVVDLTVDVILPDGQKPREASVDVTQRRANGSSSRGESWTPQDPVIRVNVGTVALRARATETEEEYASDEQEATFKAGERPAAMTFKLRGRLGIKGRVIFPKGEEADQCQVFAGRAAAGEVPTRERLREGRHDWVSRHDDYAYSFTELQAGTYYVAATRGDRDKLVAGDFVEVVDHMEVKDIEIPPIDPSEYMVVWVYGPSNEVVRDASISTGWRTRNSSSMGGGTVVRRENGSYWVFHPEPDEGYRDQDDLRHVISVSTRTFGSKEIEYRPAESGELVVRFTEPAFLDVTLARYAGSGREGAVQLSLEKAQPAGSRRTSYSSSRGEGLDAEGRQTFGPVEAGAYELQISIKGGREFSSMEVDRVPVNLRPGKNAVEVALPDLYDLTILIDDPPANARLRVGRGGEARGRSGLSYRIGKDGRVELTNLPAGEYHLFLEGKGLPTTMRLTVPGEREVRFEPKAINAIQVTIRDPAGAFGAAGLQTGDMIIGVDGKRFGDDLAIELGFMSIMGKKEARLLVARGEREFEITIDPKAFRDGPEGAGASLDPATR